MHSSNINFCLYIFSYFESSKAYKEAANPNYYVEESAKLLLQQLFWCKDRKDDDLIAAFLGF
jgi:hypothetical protein